MATQWVHTPMLLFRGKVGDVAPVFVGYKHTELEVFAMVRHKDLRLWHVYIPATQSVISGPWHMMKRHRASRYYINKIYHCVPTDKWESLVGVPQKPKLILHHA